MEVAPPRWLEVCVSLLLPRDGRECLLGDLHERLQSVPARAATRRFLLDAASAVPAAITSRLRRTVGWRLLFAEALLLSVLFLLSAFSVPQISGPAFLAGGLGFIRLLIPAAVTFVLLTLLDVYGTFEPGDLWDQFTVVALSLCGAVLVHTALGGARGSWALPRGMMPWFVAMAFALLSVMRWIAVRGRSSEGHSPVLSFAVALILVVSFARMAIVASSPVVRAGAYLTVGAAILLVWEMRRLRATETRHAAMTHWWRSAALLPGPILVSVGRALEHPNVAPAALAWIVGFLLLAAAAASLTHRVQRS